MYTQMYTFLYMFILKHTYTYICIYIHVFLVAPGSAYEVSLSHRRRKQTEVCILHKDLLVHKNMNICIYVYIVYI
jgi:hypothetical protein